MRSIPRLTALAAAAAIALAACASATTPGSAGNADVSVDNQGGDLEGHTPRGFAGSGTGLFVGDDLNPNFPEGDGVQTYLSFDTSKLPETIASAELRSDALAISGSPFEDLGPLVVEQVRYDRFGPALFDLDAVGESVCVLASATTDGAIECDVTDAVRQSAEAGDPYVQFRLKFETAGDRDGTSDMALFFKTDSNTNEPGIFTLEVVAK